MSIKDEVTTASGKIKFDSTINLGHILTFLGFIVTIFVGWQNLDKRVVVLEENRHTQLLKDKHQDLNISQQSDHIRDSLSEIKAAILRLENDLKELRK